MNATEKELQRKLNVLRHKYGELEREVTRLRKTQLIHQEIPCEEPGARSEVFPLHNVSANGRYRISPTPRREGRMRANTPPEVISEIIKE